MPTGYVIRCGNCGEDAPLAGELLSDVSEQVVAFQTDHAHAEGQFAVYCAAELIVLEPEAALVAA